jgi:molybdopterin molybdotransferase
MGHREGGRFRPTVTAVADEAFRRRIDGKVHLVRVTASVDGEGQWHVRSSGGQASNLLRAMALANALAIVPDGDGLAEGENVDAMLLT